MKHRPQTWAAWWDTEDATREALGRRHAEAFVRASAPLVRYGPEDVVLDVGCGRGDVVELLADRVKEVHGIDTSPRAVATVKARLGGHGNVFAHVLDPSNYTDLSVLGGRKFSVVLCSSVVQYYRDASEVGALLASVRRVALAGARMLVTDIPVESSSIRDTWAYLRSAARGGFLREALGYLWRLKRAGYGSMRSSLGLNVLSEERLRSIVSDLGLRADSIDLPLTHLPNRRHLLVHF